MVRKTAITASADERKNRRGRERSPSGQAVEGTDRVLVRAAMAGDQGAFETLVQRYHRPIFCRIRLYIRDDDQMWDVFQQVLLKLSVSLPTLCVRGDYLGPWLLSVTRNCCIDELRKRRITCFSELELETEEAWVLLTSVADPAPLPEEVVEQHESQRILHEAIEGLPPKLRLIVLLRCMHQLTFPEIGQQLKMPATTAKSYFYRACSLLHTTLTTQGQIDLAVG